MDHTDDYNDFLKYLNENMIKIQELLEKVTMLHNETAKALLETSALYHPKILTYLIEMEENGRKFDEYILKNQELKCNIKNLSEKKNFKSINDYTTEIEDMKFIIDLYLKPEDI